MNQALAEPILRKDYALLLKDLKSKVKSAQLYSNNFKSWIFGGAKAP